MLHILSSALTLVHMRLLRSATIALRYSSSRRPLVLWGYVRQASLIGVRNLPWLSGCHNVTILATVAVIIMLETGYAAGSSIQHIILFRLAPYSNYFGGRIHSTTALEGAHTMRSHGGLGILSCCIVIEILIRISGAVCSTRLCSIIATICWFSHLTFCFISICCCHFF